MERQIGEWPTRAQIDAYMAKFKARVASARQQLEKNPRLLTQTAHPFIRGKTLRDYVEFTMNQGGLIGELKGCVIIEEVTKGDND